MNAEDLYLYYGSIEEVEYVHTYWNTIKLSIRKENKTEQQIREEFIELINTEHYQELNKLLKNPPPMDIEEI